jgi:probable F420-dependent oxidoreductase
MTTRERLGRVGIWSPLWTQAAQSGDSERLKAAADAAAEVDDLGYGAIWLGSSPPVESAGPVLDATPRLTVATGITSIWQHDAATVDAQRARLEERHPGRFLLGLGVSHGEAIPAYAHPYAAMQRYLDELTAPAGDVVLAALGPRMLGLSRDRAAGAHPYLVTVEQVAEARQILGPAPVLAPELSVVLDTDPGRARETARGMLRRYLRMRNYTTSFVRGGYTEDDFQDGGSDRLIDALFALGDADAIAARVQAFHDAGADHVAIQAIVAAGDDQRDVWRRLHGAS